MKVQSGGVVARGAPDREAKRQAILQAAVRVFSEKGYFGARMRDVAAAAQVADGTLYLYFESKEALLTAVLEEFAETFVQEARRDCEGVSDPQKRLQAVLERHLSSFEANRPLATVFQIELRHSRKFLRQIARGQLSRYLDLLRQIVAEGIARGVFRAHLDPRLAARAIFGAVDELVTAWVLSDKPEPLKQRLAPLLEILFFGLCAENDRTAHGERGEP